MIEAIQRMMEVVRARIDADGAQQASKSADAFQIAAAALFVYVGNVDGAFVTSERDRVRRLLVDQFGMKAEDADELMMLVSCPKLHDEDLDELVGVLMSRLDRARRRQVVEMMWDIAVADDVLKASEVDFLDRVGPMLRIPPAALAEIGKRRRERLRG